MLAAAMLTGCGAQSAESSADSVTAPAAALYSDSRAVTESPKWVTKLDAAKEAEQLIVVAGYDKNTAYISMHEKQDGKWMKLLSTPGYIGLDGLGKANIEEALTPVGTFTIDKAFGIADDPGCQMDYIKVDDSYYWSGDPNHHFNELVSVNDVKELDTEESEHITDYQFQYQYVLNLGYNSECEVQNGYAFFFHCFGDRKPYTGGCVSVPENIMKQIMQKIRPNCRITIDTMENLHADFND
ncbi:MAG: hypothetical protein IKQ39_04125 [Oscillospiraceae bacterium]|nr:hypothetical protein [Oscillospiraceae bacterium]